MRPERPQHRELGRALGVSQEALPRLLVQRKSDVIHFILSDRETSGSNMN